MTGDPATWSPEDQRRAVALSVGVEPLPEHDWYSQDDGRYYKCAQCGDFVSWRVTRQPGPCVNTSDDYLNSRDAIIPVIRAIQTQAQKVKFLNAIRAVLGPAAPKNAVGAPMLSDFDLVVAEPKELTIAYLKSL